MVKVNWKDQAPLCGLPDKKLCGFAGKMVVVPFTLCVPVVFVQRTISPRSIVRFCGL
jgi:hypothetical protein